MLFRKETKAKMQETSSICSGDLYVKNDKVQSTFVVDKLLNFPQFAPHVRLKEQGGNNRSITVAVETLQDEKFWMRLPK